MARNARFDACGACAIIKCTRRTRARGRITRQVGLLSPGGMVTVTRVHTTRGGIVCRRKRVMSRLGASKKAAMTGSVSGSTRVGGVRRFPGAVHDFFIVFGSRVARGQYLYESAGWE